MKVLLDANVPHALRTRLGDHDMRTAAWEGWAALANGVLLAAAEGAGYDVLLTADQNFGGRKIALVVVTSNNLKRLLANAATIAAAIDAAEPGGFVEVEID